MDRKPLGMVDVAGKQSVLRIAVASGRIHTKLTTLDVVKRGIVEKGDPFEISRTAALLAVKKTPELIPHCHPIPIEGAEVRFDIKDDYILVEVEVKATYKTGVEMEALTGVSTALLTLWDVLKKYEKDESGNYPSTFIEDIKVIEKKKV